MFDYEDATTNEVMNANIATLSDDRNKSLIIGAGEIGASLYKILKKSYTVILRDKDDININNVEYLHICYPYSKTFIKDTIRYQKQYLPHYTIIHSTVPVETSEKCKAIHSPIIGQHPKLAESLTVFQKFLGPNNKTVQNYFQKAGISIIPVESSRTTEALKLWLTAQYGWDIVLEKEMYKWCLKNHLDFNIIYHKAIEVYNKGYSQLGLKNVIRPNFQHKDGEIGGHCVIPNCTLLKSKITKIIQNFNQGYKIPNRNSKTV